MRITQGGTACHTLWNSSLGSALQVQKDQAQILRRQTKTAFDLLRFLTLWGTVSAPGLHILGLEEPAALEDKAK